MKVLIATAVDSGNEVCRRLLTVLISQLNQAKHTTSVIELQDKYIEYCNGCNYCGNVEIGVCVKRDDMSAIYPQLAESDAYIFLAPVSFGGFHSSFKKFLDRFSPLGISMYVVHRGELHHPMRYHNLHSLLTIGFMEGENPIQEKIFKEVSGRLEIAFFAERAKSIVVHDHMQSAVILETVGTACHEMGLVSCL